MGLDLYDEDKNRLSSETMSNPLRTSHDGKNGSSQAKLFYVRNDSVNFWYDNVKVDACDTSGYDDTVGEYGTGYSVKLFYGASEPLPHEWDELKTGAPAVFPTSVTIGQASQPDTTTYYPIWARITTPGSIPAQNKTDLCLRLTGTKHPV